MGRILLFVLELLLLGIGVIQATFQASGNDDTATKELMMWVSGPAMSCTTILRYFAGSWSGPTMAVNKAYVPKPESGGKVLKMTPP